MRNRGQADRSDKYPVVIDVETYPITDDEPVPRLVCLSWACGSLTDSPSSGIFHHADPDLLVFLEGLLSDTSVILVGSYTVFDLSVILRVYPSLTTAIFLALDEDRVEDVQIRQKLIDLACGSLGGTYKKGNWVEYKYNQAALEFRHFGRDRSAEKNDPDAWRMRYGELHGVPLDQWPKGAVDYAIADAEGELEVYEEQEKSDHLLHDSFRQQRAHWGLYLQSVHGVYTCAETHALYEIYTHARLEKDREWLIREGLVVEKKRPTKTQREKGVPGPWFGRKQKLAKERMSRIHPDGPKTPTGAPQLDRGATQEAGDPLLIAYQEFGSTGTILTNLEDLRKGINTPIRTRYEILKSTGRTGSSYPNVQNRRKEFGDRECFIPRDGWVFMQADYSGLELATFSQVCIWLLGYSEMAEALNSGMDVHLRMTATILGISYDQALARYKDGDPEVKAARDLSKIANFGYGGGMGPHATVVNAKKPKPGKPSKILCDQTNHKPFGICPACLDRAYRLRDEWKATWTEARQYLETFIPSLLGGSSVAYVTYPGSFRGRGAISYTETANGFFQALGADAAKQAVWELSVHCYALEKSILYGDRPVLFVHDEIIAETPDTPDAHDHAMEFSHVMCEAANRWLPDVPVSADPCLMRRWSKEAAPIFDDSGRLIPWDCDVDARFTEEARKRGIL